MKKYVIILIAILFASNVNAILNEYDLFLFDINEELGYYSAYNSEEANDMPLPDIAECSIDLSNEEVYFSDWSYMFDPMPCDEYAIYSSIKYIKQNKDKFIIIKGSNAVQSEIAAVNGLSNYFGISQIKLDTEVSLNNQNLIIVGTNETNSLVNQILGDAVGDSNRLSLFTKRGDIKMVLSGDNVNFLKNKDNLYSAIENEYRADYDCFVISNACNELIECLSDFDCNLDIEPEYYCEGTKSYSKTPIYKCVNPKTSDSYCEFTGNTNVNLEFDCVRSNCQINIGTYESDGMVYNVDYPDCEGEWNIWFILDSDVNGMIDTDELLVSINEWINDHVDTSMVLEGINLWISQLIVCGNYVCQNSETCSNCPDDCGVC